MIKWISGGILPHFDIKSIFVAEKAKQAWAELGQAQDKLKVIVDVGITAQVKVGTEVEV